MSKPLSAPEPRQAKGVQSRAEMQSSSQSGQGHSHQALNAADGTRQLLISGFWIMLVGLAAGLLAATALGGISRQGAHSNAGWLALMFAMMSTPFAMMLLSLGGAKWLRNRRISRISKAHGSL